jgi:hypothetical protein
MNYIVRGRFISDKEMEEVIHVGWTQGGRSHGWELHAIALCGKHSKEVS